MQSPRQQRRLRPSAHCSLGESKDRTSALEELGRSTEWQPWAHCSRKGNGPAVVYWPDHNVASRSATRRRLQVSKRLRDRSSVVSTSLMVDTIPVLSRRNIPCAVNCALTIEQPGSAQ